jgi:hypothetical protein
MWMKRRGTSKRILGQQMCGTSCSQNSATRRDIEKSEAKTMRDVKDDICSCPVCHDPIPEQFYCRHCGYVPDWRRIEVYEEHRKAA